MLNDREKAEISSSIGMMVEAFSETADIYRPVTSGSGSFSGSRETSENLVATIPIEFKQLSPEELSQIGADGMCSFQTGADVQEGDIVLYNGIRFKITDMKLENCFGASTHLTARLEREYKGT